MKISRAILTRAVKANLITEKQAQDLFSFISKQPEQLQGFNLTQVLYYLGGLIAIGAMTLFMNLGWEAFGGWGLFGLSLTYALLGLFMANWFQRKKYIVPAGICATFVIAITPLAIYGFERAMGWWPLDTAYRNYYYQVEWYWVSLELGTLIMGLLLAWLYRYPFMIMPIALTLWFLSMDFAPFIANTENSLQLKTLVSLYFGLAMISLAILIDLKCRSADYAFWLYLFGVMAFWGAISEQSVMQEMSKMLYLCLNLIMILAGVVLERKVFVVFGALGLTCYLGYLASEVFKNSILFPIALSLIGLAIIFLGILWQKYQSIISKKLKSFFLQSR